MHDIDISLSESDLIEVTIADRFASMRVRHEREIIERLVVRPSVVSDL